MAGFGFVTDDAYDVSLTIILIQGIAHGFAVDGHRLILFTVCFIQALQRLIQLDGVNADDVFAWYDETAIIVASASEARAGFLTKTLRLLLIISFRRL